MENERTDEEQVVDLLTRHGFKARLCGRSEVTVHLFLDGEPEAHASAIADLLIDAGFYAHVSYDFREVWISTIKRVQNPMVSITDRIEI